MDGAGGPRCPEAACLYGGLRLLRSVNRSVGRCFFSVLLRIILPVIFRCSRGRDWGCIPRAKHTHNFISLFWVFGLSCRVLFS